MRSKTFIQYLIEAKLARSHKTWFDVLEDDARITLRNTGYDSDVVHQVVEWARINKKTLNHMYHALRGNYQEITDHEVDPDASIEEKIDHWMGNMDYRDLPIYNELVKRYDRENVSHVARMMIDTIVDEIRREN